MGNVEFESGSRSGGAEVARFLVRTEVHRCDIGADLSLCDDRGAFLENCDAPESVFRNVKSVKIMTSTLL